MNTDLHFSSNSEEWLTPRYLFDYFNNIYSFELDPCSTAENALCPEFYTVEDDGLAKPWAGKRVFMNPPYGRDIEKWVKKAYSEALYHDALVVCLLPARTDTTWFWDYCQHGAIRFLQGRVKFSGHKNCAPFPSMIVIFKRHECYKHLMLNDHAQDFFIYSHKEIKTQQLNLSKE